MADKSGKLLAGSSIEFKNLPASLKEGESAKVEMTVSSGDDSAAEASAAILNAGKRIGIVQIVRHALAVSVVYPDAEAKQLIFTKGEQAIIYLRNSTAVPVTLKWKVALRGEDVCGTALPPNLWSRLAGWFASPVQPCVDVHKWNTVWLGGDADGQLHVPSQNHWFSHRFHSLFKEDVAKGQLRLVLAHADGTPFDKGPALDREFNARLLYESDGSRQTWRFLVVFLLLAAGGACALIARNWVPNHLRKRSLKDELQTTDGKIADLSNSLDSSVRVAVQAEHNRLWHLLKSRYCAVPDAAVALEECSRGLALLNRRVTMLKRIDTVNDVRIKCIQKCPPTLLASVEELLQKGTQLLRSAEPTDAELQQTSALIDEAIRILERCGHLDEDFSEDLSRRYQELCKHVPMEELTTTAERSENPNTWAGFSRDLPRPFNVMERDLSTPSAVTAFGDYIEMDVALASLCCIRDYVSLHQGSLDAEFRRKIEACRTRLVAALSCQSFERLRSARLLVQQMKEGVFVEDVEAAIQNREFTIELEPPVLRTMQPARLRVEFRRRELNTSAARECITVRWQVGPAKASEIGWVVSHYFPKPKPQVSTFSRFRRLIAPSGSTVESQPSGEHRYSIRVAFDGANGQPLRVGPSSAAQRPKVAATTASGGRVEVTAGFSEAGSEAGSSGGSDLQEPGAEFRIDPPVIRDSYGNRKDRLFAEVVGLGIVLVVTFIGLVGAAGKQLEQGDLITGLVGIFVLGFTADAIRNVIAPQQSQTQS